MTTLTDAPLGLTSSEAADRLVRSGPNSLTEAERRAPWKLFLDQFRSVLIVVLITAAVVAGLVGDLKDSIVIAVVLLVNAILGFLQEHRAEASLAALRSMLDPTARVRRDGQLTEVRAETIVEGDIVLVEAGDRIPADGRVVVSVSCEVDESSLTGESIPVAKTPEGDISEERADRVFMNTTVARGRAELLVTSTGMSTEIGRLAGLLATTESVDTPLQRELDQLGKRLAVIAAVAVAFFFALGMLRGQKLTETALSAVALAVAAIPEGLPAVVTVTLALGVSQMSKRGAIVKRLSSVETLGSTTVICSDKTGTLTLNQMTVDELIVVGGASESDALLPGLLCNDGVARDDAVVGDPTETALLVAGRDRGVDLVELTTRYPRIAEVPFDSATKLMVTFHRQMDDPTDAVLVAVKGAYDVMMPLLESEDPGHADELHRLAARGRRVLGLASTEVSATAFDRAANDPAALLALATDLRLTALAGIVDPPRPEARDAIALARRAGIRTIMITGDHAITAGAIAADLGVQGRALTGADVEAMDDQQLRDVVGEVGVFARVAPEHKLRIVEALQATGEVVAMTGDGVNDAPALKRADVGVAMGITGTEVSKEAATMVLTDDDFSTIIRAVESGRTIYDNIVTFLRFQLTTNFGAIFSLVGAQIIGLPVPFSAVQLLWINLIMDGPPALTMGVDPPRADTMSRPPRSGSSAILNRSRLTVLLVNGFVMAVTTLGVLAFYDDRGTVAHAATLAFTTFVMLQIFGALCARAEHRSVFHRDTLSNSKLWIALAAVAALQFAAVHIAAIQSIFDTVDLSGWDWLVAVAVGSTVLWADELRKLVVKRAG